MRGGVVCEGRGGYGRGGVVMGGEGWLWEGRGGYGRGGVVCEGRGGYVRGGVVMGGEGWIWEGRGGYVRGEASVPHKQWRWRNWILDVQLRGSSSLEGTCIRPLLWLASVAWPALL